MEAPVAFQNRLSRDFGGRLRIRWSDATQQWQLEERVGRAAMPASPKSPDDNKIRATEGYGLVLTVAPGDREPCKKCGSTIRLPTFDFAETRCSQCGTLTRSCYWPLTDILLEHLRKIDPLRDGPSRLRDEADAHTRRMAESRQRKTTNELEAVTLDHFNEIAQIPTFGYTGREAMWER